MHWLCPYASSKPFVLAYSELQSFGNSIVGYLMKVHTSLCTYFCQKSFYCNAKYLLYMTSFCPPTPLNLMSNPFWVCTLWFLCVCMNIYTYLYIYQSIDIILIQSYINLDLYHFIYTHITGYMSVCAYTYTYITYTLYTHICTHIHIV